MEFEYPINTSLIRANMPLGIELLPLGFVVTPLFSVAFLCGVFGGYSYGAILAALGIVAYVGFYQLAKTDPYACRVYFRACMYKRIYAPRPTIHKRYVGSGGADGLLRYVAFGCISAACLLVGAVIVALVFG